MLEAFLFCVAVYVVGSILAEIWIHFRSKKVHWVARFESSQGGVVYLRGYGKRRIGRRRYQRVINPANGTVTQIEHATRAIPAIRRSDWEFVRFEKYVDQPYLTHEFDFHVEEDAAIHEIHQSLPLDQPVVARDLRPPGI